MVVAVEYEFPIERGHILAFARSLGEESPKYVRDGTVSGEGDHLVTAPPTFLQASVRFAPSHAFRTDHSEAPTTLDRDADVHHLSEDGGGTFFHAEQHFEYRRAVVAGETLRVVVGEARSSRRSAQFHRVVH